MWRGMLRDNNDVVFIQEDSVPYSLVTPPDYDTDVCSPPERIFAWVSVNVKTEPTTTTSRKSEATSVSTWMAMRYVV